MRSCRALACVLLLVWTAACASDELRLVRGPLGPASYSVRLAISGDASVRAESLSAVLQVSDHPQGASLLLDVDGSGPVRAELRRRPDGKLALETVAGVSPRSAGETDLASLVGQLDPPLPAGRVHLDEPWTSTRSISTSTLEAQLTSRLRAVGFRHAAGIDGARVHGTVDGRLRTSTATGIFQGTVRGTLDVVWGLKTGRLVASDTRLEWTIPGVGRINVESRVEPRP